MTVERPDLIIEDGRVVQLVTFSGTNTGGFMGMPSTGKKFTFSAVLICTMRDGLIAHETRIYDFTGFLMEIGVLKAKPA
jgi:predicted ester cyclase